MSGPAVSPSLRLVVRQRANGRCEYCLLHEVHALLPHEPDHIVAAQHGGQPTLANLALACFDCNWLKGPNIASIDMETDAVVPLFHPRHDNWAEHFRVEGARIVPLTPKGRTTAALLRFNGRERLLLREALVKAGKYP